MKLKPNNAISLINYLKLGYLIGFEGGTLRAIKIGPGWIVEIKVGESIRTPFITEDFFEKFICNLYPSL
jgi:hypothetical protein